MLRFFFIYSFINISVNSPHSQCLEILQNTFAKPIATILVSIDSFHSLLSKYIEIMLGGGGCLPPTPAVEDKESTTYIRQDRALTNHKDIGMCPEKQHPNLRHSQHCILSRMLGISAEQWSRRGPILLVWKPPSTGSTPATRRPLHPRCGCPQCYQNHLP